MIYCDTKNHYLKVFNQLPALKLHVSTQDLICILDNFQNLEAFLRIFFY
jgi:hypothetical protein